MMDIDKEPKIKAPLSEDDRKKAFIEKLVRDATCAEDLFATRAEAHWLDEPDFQNAYAAAENISVWGSKIRWRVYTLVKSAQAAARLNGNFVECGANRGGTAMAVLTYVSPAAFDNRKFFLFDTFNGLVEEQLSEAERKLKHDNMLYPPVVEIVRQTFAPYNFVSIVQGAVPESLIHYDGQPVAYLHIDMNVVLPEVAALRFFWPLLLPGAPVIFDDYGFPRHSAQRIALDELAKELGTQIMMLPTGQGLLWKMD